MKTIIRRMSTASLVVVLAACSAPSLLTVTVAEGDNHVVRLLAIPEANQGKGFSHPATIPPATLETILNGLLVEEPTSLVPLAFGGGSSVRRAVAFGEAEARLLAPMLAKGLSMATREELVTFYETAEISATQRVVTSGGVYVQGDQLHVLLSNHRTKLDIKQDNEEYDAPYRQRPMVPIRPKPGRLLFEPSRYMVPLERAGLGNIMSGQRLNVAVRYTRLPSASQAEDPALPSP